MKKKAISMSHISKAVLIATTFCIFSNQSFASQVEEPREPGKPRRVSMYGAATAIEAAKRTVASACVSGDQKGVEQGTKKAQNVFSGMTPVELLLYLTTN